ncbi:MAG: hypothetical protein ABI877_07160, partial [Gemmatimonadaceae bacterium]
GMTAIGVDPRSPNGELARGDVVLRAYVPTDRAAVRDLCCRSAFRNMGVRALIDDSELFGDFWASYYTDFEPESLLVAEREGRVIGYLMGCADTERYRRVMARVIVPRVLGRLVSRAVRGRYRNQPHARPFLRWLAVRSWREEPAIDTKAFPGHYHVNLAREGVRHRLYTSLGLRFLDQLDARAVTHLHGQVLDAEHDGVWDRMVRAFATHPECTLVRRWEKPSTLGRDVLGVSQPLVNRAFGSSVPVFRAWLHFLAGTYGL